MPPVPHALGKSDGTPEASRGATGAPAGLPKLRLLLVVHVMLLIAIRLITDADDFNNWDLISFLNANSFSSLSALLRLPEVHFGNPFSFPLYNTGAESVVSIIVHRLMAGVSLYWSNVAVLVVYDALFLAALYGLFRLVFADALIECLAWILVAMSPVLLTFPSISAFDMQAFATITVALLGCECALQSRPRAGGILLVAAFVGISQAYPLTFFLPLFCVVWVAGRSMMHYASASTDGEPHRDRFVANALGLVAVVAALTLAVHAASGGAYLRKAFRVVADPLAHAPSGNATTAVFERLVKLSEAAFLPNDAAGNFAPGFAPYFAWLALALFAILALVQWQRTPPDQRSAKRATLAQRCRHSLSALAWTGIVVFGYLPALFGNHPKSQRCEFGDLFLAMAIAACFQWLLRRRRAAAALVLGLLLALLGVSDAYYLASVLSIDHTRNHRPVFDYDVADGIARHDLVSAIKIMRDQVVSEDAGLIVYYPRGNTENTTDPAMFFARFLRHFGPHQRQRSLIFPCHFCSVRYGCPFPDVRGRGCAQRCCYHDPMKDLRERPQLHGRKLYLWWFTDSAMPDEPRRSAMLASLRRMYRIGDAKTPALKTRWSCYELTPRSGRAKLGRNAR